MPSYTPVSGMFKTAVLSGKSGTVTADIFLLRLSDDGYYLGGESKEPIDFDVPYKLEIFDYDHLPRDRWNNAITTDYVMLDSSMGIRNGEVIMQQDSLCRIYKFQHLLFRRLTQVEKLVSGLIKAEE